MNRRRALARVAAAGCVAGVLAASLPSTTAGATSLPGDTVLYTMLGRGYAVMFGYPADEVPPTGEDEPPATPPPDQGCPDGSQGIDPATAERIKRLSDTSGLPETPPRAVNEVPTPRGQPIKFNFGLADTSLRSDPGAHAIASFFYVDLGGGQDPGTTAEADATATDHARHQERCAQPYSSRPGTADNVHLISRAVDGPYAMAFNQAQNIRFGPLGSVQKSVTMSEMAGRWPTATAKVVTLVEGVAFGPVTADSVTSVVEYSTDGFAGNTKLRTFVRAANVRVNGQDVKLTQGAVPVARDGMLLGLSAPEVRTRADGTLEVTAGGLYIGAEAPNPVGLQSKQAIFIGAAELTASFSRVPPVKYPTPDPVPSDPTPRPQPVPAPPPNLPVAQPPAPPVVTSSPQPAPSVVVPPPVVPAVRSFGVYRKTAFPAGPAVVGGGALLALLLALFGWSRHRFAAVAGALRLPVLRWLDYGYRAFVRG